MNLVVDIGNTVIKTATFNNGTLVSFNIVEEKELDRLLKKEWDGILISTVRDQNLYKGALILDSSTPLPINIQYDTPKTLGVDRIAAAVGAFTLSPNSNSLVIDIGTCVTFEFIDNTNTYKGGLISPGWQMRLDAMHKFTAKLPSLTTSASKSITGKSTVECMQSGAFIGLIAEINSIIEQYKAENNDLRVLICGGDAKVFETTLKERIFAEPNLVLIGLNTILEYNNAN